MKLGSITKLNKRNKTMSKKFEYDVISKKCEVNAIFIIYDQSGAIWKPRSALIVCKTYIFINGNLLSYKS